MNILQPHTPCNLMNTSTLPTKYPEGGRGVPANRRLKHHASYRSKEPIQRGSCKSATGFRDLGCKVLQNIFFILSAKDCPNSHMANHSPSERRGQSLGSGVASAAVRIELSLSYIRLLGARSSLHRLLGIRLCRGCLSQNHRCTCNRSQDG